MPEQARNRHPANAGDMPRLEVHRPSASSTAARTLVLVLSALTLGMTFAHVLELPPRLAYEAELWTTLTQPNALYRYFGVVGGPLEIIAVIACVALAFAIRPHRARRLAIMAAVLHAAALLTWLAVVAPANMEIGQWAASAIPSDWERWRVRWEAGHAFSFVLLLAGFTALAAAVLKERE